MLPRALLSLALLAGGGEGEFKVVDTVDGVEVASRPVSGSRFVELRFRLTTEKTIESLCDAAFGDGKLDPNEDVKGRKILEVKPDERVSYDEVSAPLISDRDYVVRIKRYRAAGGVCGTEYEAANDKAPALREGWIRIEKLWGGWRFEPAADGKSTQVTYVNFTDPGGSLPTWVVEGPRRKNALRWIQRVLNRAK